MYFAVAEKSNGGIFTRWSSRLLAFDCRDSYLYYTASRKRSKTGAALSSTESSGANLRQQETSVFPSSEGGATFASTQAGSLGKNDYEWKRVQIFQVIPVARERDVSGETSDRALYELEVMHVVDTTPAANGHVPPPPCDTLICPTVGPSRHYARVREEGNPELSEDPFFQREIYEAIRDFFVALRREREMEAERERRASESGGVSATESPTPPTRSPTKESEKRLGNLNSITFRFDCEFEFWRFYYAVTLVLGFQRRAQRRPYFGFPPFDPRNSIAFSPLPAANWNKMQWLCGCHDPYILVYGDLVGVKSGNKSYVMVEGCHLVVDHDYAFVVSAAGEAVHWVELCRVHTFHYKADTPRPYAVFLSDGEMADILFLARPNPKGRFLPDRTAASGRSREGGSQHEREKANKGLSEEFCIRRLASVMRRTCYGCVETRRAIIVKAVPFSSLIKWVEWWHSGAGSELGSMSSLSTYPNRDAAASRGTKLYLELAKKRYHYPGFPLTRKPLKKVWTTLNEISSQINIAQRDSTAVPLYEWNTNSVSVTPQQLEIVSQLLEQESMEDQSIVGISLSDFPSVEELLVRETSNAGSVSASGEDLGGASTARLRAAVLVATNLERNETAVYREEAEDPPSPLSPVLAHRSLPSISRSRLTLHDSVGTGRRSTTSISPRSLSPEARVSIHYLRASNRSGLGLGASLSSSEYGEFPSAEYLPSGSMHSR